MNSALRQTAAPETTLQAGKNVDKLLEDRSQFTRLLLDGISTGALLLSPEGQVLDCNRAAASLLGRSADELVGKPLAAAISDLRPLIQKSLSAAVARAAAGENSACDVEFYASLPADPHPDPADAHAVDPRPATPTVLDFRFRPIAVQSGSKSPVLAEIHDATAELSEHRTTDEARYSQSALVESPQEAIIGNNLNGNIESWNPAAASLFGYSAEEIVGQPITRLIPEELRAEEEHIMSKIRAGERIHNFETTRVSKSGRHLFVSFDVSPVLDASGKIVGASRIVRDTSERRRLGDARSRLASIVESSDAIAGKDLNGIITSWNRAAERLFGYTAEEMIGQHISKIIPPELVAGEADMLSTIARGERIEHFETVRLKKDRETVDVSLTVSPIRDETGKIVGAAKIAHDITQQKRTESALRASERLASVGRLAATVAHEINNPLEAVTNLIFLARHAESIEEARKFLSMVEEELERISRLTRQTLGFYRETKGVARVRLGDIVESLISVFTPRMRNKGIKISSDIDDTLEVIAVPGEIRQVAANLLSNSIDALDAGGEICLRVSASMRWDQARIPGARLTIRDTGPGIPAKIRSRLFEPFFTTKKDVGTGLGLWICKSIVENYSGSIQVRSSTASGKSGTTFSVFLPTPTSNAAGQSAESAESPGTNLGAPS